LGALLKKEERERERERKVKERGQMSQLKKLPPIEHPKSSPKFF
jgi:hypothetical protein